MESTYSTKGLYSKLDTSSSVTTREDEWSFTHHCLSNQVRSSQVNKQHADYKLREFVSRPESSSPLPRCHSSTEGRVLNHSSWTQAVWPSRHSNCCCVPPRPDTQPPASGSPQHRYWSTAGPQRGDMLVLHCGYDMDMISTNRHMHI